MKLVRTNFSRVSVKNDTENIYIFTDNCDRTSGRYKIPDDSSYSKRFGKNGLCYPSSTSALIRGLERAFPITTQKKYIKEKGKSSDGNWTDEDFEEFKKVIDADFEAIKAACKKFKPKIIFFPGGGILNGPISQITFIRTPLLYNYIVEKEIELRDFNVE